MLFDRIKTEKEDEREGSPSSLSSPRVRRTTRASAKSKFFDVQLLHHVYVCCVQRKGPLVSQNCVLR